jgi:alpha-glucoside transport system permease protein
MPTPDRRRRPPRTARFRRPGAATGAVRLVLGLVCLLWMVPVVGLLVSSFRTRDAQQSSGWWTAPTSPLGATQWTLDNYVTVLTTRDESVNMGAAFVNSFVVTVPATALPILVAAFAAYAFTFMTFPGRQVFFVVIVGLLVVPIQVALIPLLRLYGSLGLNQTFVAVWLVHIGFGMPLAIYILRAYMSHLPRAIFESAMVDGAGHFTIFWRLVVPMSVPAFVSFAIFQFLWVWNDLLVTLLFLGRGENTTSTVALQGLQGREGEGVELIPSAGFVAIAVPVAVFLVLQRYFVRGMTAGAVTG